MKNMSFPHEIIKHNFSNGEQPFYCITIKDELPKIEKTSLPSNLQPEQQTTLVYGNTNCFYSFAAIDKTGYYWSSRPSIFNAILNLTLVENLYINNCATHFLQAEVVKSFLPEGYDIKKIIDNNKEIHYKIIYIGK